MDADNCFFFKIGVCLRSSATNSFLMGLWIGPATYTFQVRLQDQRLLGIEGRKAFDYGHAAEFLVCRDEDR